MSVNSDIKTLLREKGVDYLSLTHQARRQLFKKEKRRARRQQEAERRAVLKLELAKTWELVGPLEKRLETLNEEERTFQELCWVAREKEIKSHLHPTSAKTEIVPTVKEVKKIRVEQQVVPMTHLPFSPVAHRECSFFVKIGACRFGDGCMKLHSYPPVSKTLVFPHLFSEIGVSGSMVDKREQDVELEIDDTELYQRYLAFYDDVYPEVRLCGRVLRFEVCANYASHLKGNVFVEFERTEDAVRCRLALNGRWYNRRLVRCEFSSVGEFNRAICEEVSPDADRLKQLRGKRPCTRGNSCNYWHVFKRTHKWVLK